MKWLKIWWWRLEVRHLMGELEAIIDYWPHMNSKQRELAKADRAQMRRELAAAQRRIAELTEGTR